jgi:hypothetical protein
MSREDDFKARMIDDTTASPVIVGGTALMATLSGGVFTKGEVGREGITRLSAPAAFASGFLIPCALVKQRGLVPDGQIRDEETQLISGTQVIEIYVYEDSGYTSIEAAISRLVKLFLGHQFSDSFSVEWINLIDREREAGSALLGASLARIDFLVRSVPDF